MLSEEESEKIKQQLISHIESTFPEDKKESAINQIELMDSEQLEGFLEKNNLLKIEENNLEEQKNECVFCSIALDKIHSCKIAENNEAIAVFEINPISKGHSLIIPKNHENFSEKEIEKLTKEVSKRIKEKFKPKEIKTSKSKLFGHEVINILPVYKEEDFNSERHSAKMEELEKLKEELEKEERKEEPEPIIEKVKEFFRLPKRIP